MHGHPRRSAQAIRLCFEGGGQRGIIGKVSTASDALLRLVVCRSLRCLPRVRKVECSQNVACLLSLAYYGMPPNLVTTTSASTPWDRLFTPIPLLLGIRYSLPSLYSTHPHPSTPWDLLFTLISTRPHSAPSYIKSAMPTPSVQDAHKCLEALFQELGSTRAAARKRAMACIASLSAALSDKLLGEIVTSIVAKMNDSECKLGEQLPILVGATPRLDLRRPVSPQSFGELTSRR